LVLFFGVVVLVVTTLDEVLVEHLLSQAEAGSAH